MLHTGPFWPDGGRTHGEVDVTEGKDALRVWQGFKSLRKAGDVGDVDHKTAWRWLRAAIGLGLTPETALAAPTHEFRGLEAQKVHPTYPRANWRRGIARGTVWTPCHSN